ncbi:ammonium transporter [Spartinivicinus poritis]|uniref:histidine kinase n=1 Tax=Spartinivicinus poritis TaxID=2994640 RepID=A0ABT5UEZ4_9GAMM|nr:ammonium transporter [Spartinivicinus sp. A2-2]MDE1464760.1 ammonium transporter [Spartinivicinus sp. A2-2]
MPQLTVIDQIWMLICAALVFTMQLGFTSLEAGITRSKNTINVAMKNATDLVISVAAFWLVGYSLMYGDSFYGLVGLDTFALYEYGSSSEIIIFFFQAMFCATAVTLMSGAVAERLRYRGFIFIAMIISLVIYPLFGHWAWHTDNSQQGWLAALGFYDYAGSTVVHSLGGWVALAAVIVIGPRQQRFNKNGEVNQFSSHNLAISLLGTLLLWLGWFGFNGGSNFTFNEQSVIAVVNTLLGGTAGGCAVLSSLLKNRNVKIHPTMLLNGCLAGLVSVTAGANVLSSWGAIFMGGIGGYVMISVSRLLVYMKIDDAVDAIAVHLGAGCWGTLGLVLISPFQPALAHWDALEQFAIQCIGVIVCGLWAFGVSFLALHAINRFTPLRVTPVAERMGLNITEHGAPTELHDFMDFLHQQTIHEDLSLRANIDPFSEIGVIAEKYNQVLDKLQQTVTQSNVILQSVADPIIAFKPNDLIVVSVNKATKRLFGYGLEEMLNKPITQLVSAEKMNTLLKRKINTKYEEIEGRRADGKKLLLEVSLAKTALTKNNYYTLILKDISERKEKELQVLNAKQQAENTLEKLQSMQNHLVQTEKLAALGQLVAGIAHEVNTPLGIAVTTASHINGEINQIIGDYSSGELTEEVFNEGLNKIQESVQLLLKNANRASQLIRSFKTVAVDQTNAERRLFKLQSYLEDILDSLRPNFRKTNIIITVQCDDAIELDSYPGLLAQIITNLLMNSLIHGFEPDQHGKIVLEVNRKGATHITLLYKDNGKGISLDIIPHIYEPFYTTRRGKGGSGLGLHIVHNLVVGPLGGQIETLTPDQGAAFLITLPMSVP